MSTTISNTDNVIDSRDVIERIEELSIGIADAMNGTTGAQDYDSDNIKEENYQKLINSLPESFESDIEELFSLLALEEEVENYSDDWMYGATLIHVDYFEQYMDDMVEDCYELPKDLPYWMSITLDYDALEQDYSSVDFDGQEYLIR